MKERGSGKSPQKLTSQKEQGSYHKESSTNTPLVSPVKQSEVLNPSPSEKLLRDLRAQLQMVGTLFAAEITLLPDGTLHILDGHYLSRISPRAELEQVDLDLKESGAVGDGQREG